MGLGAPDEPAPVRGLSSKVPPPRCACPNSTLPSIPMSSPPPPKNTARGMVAGTMLLSGVLLGGLVGGVIGALVGALGPFLAVGIFFGFALGIAAVIIRFRDL
jgi:predicted lipid-binding transport protein (Tim44 family)